MAKNGPVQYAIDMELGDHAAARIGVSFWIIVERSIPSFDHILITPSSPAVSRPVPSGLHRAAFIDPTWAFTIRSARALRFSMIYRPSLLQINNESLVLLPLLLPGPAALAAVRVLHSHCKSNGKKSSGSLATCVGTCVFTSHLYKCCSSLSKKNLRFINHPKLWNCQNLPNCVDFVVLWPI